MDRGTVIKLAVPSFEGMFAYETGVWGYHFSNIQNF